jgi:hypothetical protein
MIPVVLRDIIRGLPGEDDRPMRKRQARALTWFWTNMRRHHFKMPRLRDLEKRFSNKPSDPIAALLLTAAK